MSLEEEVGELLLKAGLTLGTVESATGGLIAHRLTNVPGSSNYFKGAVVAYSGELKMKLVGVAPQTLERAGAVSYEVAKEMAEGGRRALGVEVCVADTGIAGPGGATPKKPVGLFYIGLSSKEGTIVRRHHFYGNRRVNKASAAEAALLLLKEFLEGLATS